MNITDVDAQLAWFTKIKVSNLKVLYNKKNCILFDLDVMLEMILIYSKHLLRIASSAV